jgi:hypothetical protein
MVHSVREGAIRLAPHWYTTTEQWSRAISVVTE